MVIIFDRLVSAKVLPANPNNAVEQNAPTTNTPIAPQIVALLKQADYSAKAIGDLLWDGLKDSRMVFRWLLFGPLLATSMRAFVPTDTCQTLFGPTIAGLFLTLVVAPIIKVCAEGSAPIAADILTRGAAPGNGLPF